MKRVIFLLCLLSFSAFASDGRDAAFQFCEGLQFYSNRDACLRVVRPGRYYDLRAIQVCENVTFDNNKVDCIRAIRDKDYVPSELRVCADETIDSRIVSCLSRSGIPHRDDLNRSWLRSQIEDARHAVRTGNTRRAMAILDDVLRSLD